MFLRAVLILTVLLASTARFASAQIISMSTTSECLGSSIADREFFALLSCDVTAVAEQGIASGSPRLVVHPNPASGAATFRLDQSVGRSAVDVYDASGRLVAVLPISGRSTAGWSPGDETTSGVYFARLQGTQSWVKFLLLR